MKAKMIPSTDACASVEILSRDERIRNPGDRSDLQMKVCHRVVKINLLKILQIVIEMMQIEHIFRKGNSYSPSHKNSQPRDY